MDPFGRAAAVADFVLRAILTRPETLSDVRAAASDVLLEEIREPDQARS